MPNTIDDIACTKGVWTRLTPLGPPDSFAVMNRGEVMMLVKKGGVVAPASAAGAIALGPGRMLPPEDLKRFGLDAWALSEAADGRAAVEALYA